jgi:hypothetical protein
MKVVRGALSTTEKRVLNYLQINTYKILIVFNFSEIGAGKTSN